MYVNNTNILLLIYNVIMIIHLEKTKINGH